MFFVHSGQAALLIDLQSFGIETLWVPRHDAVVGRAARDVGSVPWDKRAVLFPWLLHMNNADGLWWLVFVRERLLSKQKCNFKRCSVARQARFGGGGGACFEISKVHKAIRESFSRFG